MQLSALLPVLALLVSSAPAIAAHSPLDRRIQHAAHSKLVARDETAHLHARAAERIAESVERREAKAVSPRGALSEKPRKVKRAGATGCRARNAVFTPSSSASASPVVQVQAVQAAAASSTAAPAAASSAAAPVSSDNAQPSASASSNNNGNGGNNGNSGNSNGNNAALAGVSVSVSVGGGGGSSGGGSSGGGGLTPNGIKAGLSGTDMIDIFGSHVGWYWDYTPTGNSGSSLTFMPTLWGDGNTGAQDAGRLADWNAMNWNPQYVQGFYEPDCSPPMSSSIDPGTAAPLWNSLVVPWKAKGAMLVSPGMCKQADENWLQPFLSAGAQEWDITSIHINKLDMTGAQADIDHYWNTYGKPIWVTEFACVDDQNGFTPSEDQGQINQFINDIVDLLEGDGRIYAYSMSEGEGLGNTWPPYSNGQLTQSGQTYLNAVSKYH